MSEAICCPASTDSREIGLGGLGMWSEQINVQKSDCEIA